MNFTREPIIETIITPKDGYKLILRNSKGGSQEEYSVDAIEVVSFGHSFFFRSLERPKSFLVPVSDYEVVETKETRVVLKNATFERSIKIGGGRKVAKEAEEAQPAAVEKKRERRRQRKRRTPSEEKLSEEPKPAEVVAAEGGGPDDEVKTSSSMLRRLIPPPTKLISATLSREAEETIKAIEGNVLPEPVEEEKPKRAPRKKKAEPKKKAKKVASEEAPKEEPEKKEEASKEKTPPEKKDDEDIPPNPEGGEVQRMAIEETETVTSTSFSAVNQDSSPFGKIW